LEVIRCPGSQTCNCCRRSRNGYLRRRNIHKPAGSGLELQFITRCAGKRYDFPSSRDYH
jgi:hypothetical protein